MRNWKPIFIENSNIPVFLSYLSPISIGAITLGFIVISRERMDEQTRRHETIHFQQYIETLFVGFLILYFYDYIKNYFLYRSSKLAYLNIRAEIEAYNNDLNEDYLSARKRYNWI